MDLELTENFLATPHRFLFHTPTATAILSDLHLGIEEELRAAGTAMPDFTQPHLTAAFDHLLARNPRHIIIAGDLFDSTSPTDSAVNLAFSLFKKIPAETKISITPGNHDPHAEALLTVFAPPRFTLDHHIRLENSTWTITHGDSLFPLADPLPPLILGHQHPAIFLANKTQSAKMICYAKITPPNAAPIILLPAFSTAPLGSSLQNPRHWILDLPTPNPANIRIAGIVKDSVLDFGPLNKL